MSILMEIMGISILWYPFFNGNYGWYTRKWMILPCGLETQKVAPDSSLRSPINRLIWRYPWIPSNKPRSVTLLGLFPPTTSIKFWRTSDGYASLLTLTIHFQWLMGKKQCKCYKFHWTYWSEYTKIPGSSLMLPFSLWKSPIFGQPTMANPYAARYLARVENWVKTKHSPW